MTLFCELILGGAGSGKSALAEQRALHCGLERVYIATAAGDDEEMAARITHHRQYRNETGLGVVPTGALSRRFVDAAGFLHQRLAALCQRVTLTVVGLPMTLKSSHEQ